MKQERPSHTLQTQALLHEAYLRLVDARVDWRDRAHFLAIAARTMRRILVDHARRHAASKRTGDGIKLSLDEALVIGGERAPQLIALDEALRSLEKMDPQKSRIVELRYFAGMSIEETATVMGMAVATVVRHWSLARAWLHKQME
jgi:RNA polymerase sigma factor (TIGR02999 family)